MWVYGLNKTWIVACFKLCFKAHCGLPTMKWRCQTPPCLVSTFEDIAVLAARSMPGFLCCTVCVSVEARCLLAPPQIAFNDRQSFVVCYRCSRLSCVGLVFVTVTLLQQDSLLVLPSWAWAGGACSQSCKILMMARAARLCTTSEGIPWNSTCSERGPWCRIPSTSDSLL